MIENKKQEKIFWHDAFFEALQLKKVNQTYTM